MSDNNTWFKMYRKLIYSDIWLEERVFSRAEAWIELVCLAQYTKGVKQVYMGKYVIPLEYSQTCKSQKSWAKRWRWSRKKVSTWLKFLEKSGKITIKPHTVCTIISLVKFSAYQDNNGSEAIKGASSAHREHTQSTPKAHREHTSKEGIESNKVNKGNNNTLFENFKVRWNNLGYGQCKVLSPGRILKLKTRFNEPLFKDNQDDIFIALSKATWMKGGDENYKTGKTYGPRPIDYIIANSDNYIKLLEGGFEDNKKAQKQNNLLAKVYVKNPNNFRIESHNEIKT